MALVIPNAIEQQFLDDIFSTYSPMLLDLYDADITPSATSTWADFSGDIADFSGYSQTSLYDGTHWSDASDDGSGTAYVQTLSSVDYSNSGTSSATLYGYTISWMNGSTQQLLWAEKWASAKTLTAGGLFELTPRLTGATAS